MVSFHTLYFECFFEVLFLFQVKPFSNRCIQKSIYFYVIFFINIKIKPVFLTFFGRISNDWKANFFLVLGHLKSIGNLLYFYMFPLLLLFIPKQCHAHNSTQWSMVWKSQSVRESFLQPFFQIKSIVTQRDKRSVKVVLIMIHFCMLNERFSHSYVYSIWLFYGIGRCRESYLIFMKAELWMTAITETFCVFLWFPNFVHCFHFSYGWSDNHL